MKSSTTGSLPPQHRRRETLKFPTDRGISTIGFSVLELVIGLSIAAIITFISVPQLSAVGSGTGRAHRECYRLKSNLDAAALETIEHGRSIELQFTDQSVAIVESRARNIYILPPLWSFHGQSFAHSASSRQNLILRPDGSATAGHVYIVKKKVAICKLVQARTGRRQIILQ